MAKYERPSTAYTPITISANLTKYQDDRDAVPPVPISSEKVDADINKAFDHLNDLDADIIAIVAGGLPSQTGNTGKFLSSNGTSASWNFINTANLVDLSVTTAKIVDNSVTLAKQAAGTSNTIQGFAGSGDPTEITTDNTLDLTSDVLSVKDVGVTLAKLAPMGTTGQTLTSNGASPPTMQDTAGAWTLLSSATASASGSIEFTSGITSTYDAYMVRGVGVRPTTDASHLFTTVSTDSGATWLVGTTYTHGLKYLLVSANTVYGESSAGAAYIRTQTTGTDNTVSTSYLNFEHVFNNLSDTALYKDVSIRASVVGDTDSHSYDGSSIIQTAAAVNAIKYAMNAGSISVGKFYLYGLKKS